MEIKEKNSFNCNRKAIINNKINQMSNICGSIINNRSQINNTSNLGVNL